MNRDEKRTRAHALPPSIEHAARRSAVFPREPTGGTWVGVNDAGICLALINWHRIQTEPTGTLVSRGDVILRLLYASSPDEITKEISRLPLHRLRPFRLIAIIPEEQDLTEWQWNVHSLEPHAHPWSPNHWFSSGYDELTAEFERQRVCDARNKTDSATIDSLRQLHRSHAPERGPFSICMHRGDAKTVSYTEVVLEKDVATMRYRPGSACGEAPFDETVLQILQSGAIPNR